MTKLLREPLFHFLLIGAALFAAAGLRRGAAPIQLGSSQSQTQKIMINPGDVESLIAGFENLWHRSPTAPELDALIQGRIREEVYYREALKMGLDRDDAIVRSRLQEKLEFLSQDVKPPAPPSEQELKSFYAAHAEKFRAETEYSFRLIFLDAGRHGADTVKDSESILARLTKNPTLDAAPLGDRLPSGRVFLHVKESGVSKALGTEFAAALPALQPGKWSGPVRTEDGVYLVYLEMRSDGQLPAFDQIRAAVLQEWQAVQRRQANDAFYRNLLRSYSVTINPPAGVRVQAESEPGTQ